MVTGVAISAQRTVTTDDRGNYEIGNLPPGRYVVRASKAGYLTSPYGGRGTTPIDLAERQTLGPQILEALRRTALPVTLGPGEMQSVDLRLNP